MRNKSLPVLAAVLLASCSALPASGPSAHDIQARSGPVDEQGYGLVDLDDDVIAVVSGRPDPSLRGTFGSQGGGASETIGIGDRIVVSIWEAGAGGLFSAPVNDFGIGTKNTTIPEQPVSAAGTINIPYGGPIRAAGRTPDQVKAAIEAALAGKAIEPQVLVQVTQPVANSVTLVGDAGSSARVPLTPRGDRLLDVIAVAGGVTAPVHEAFVKLARGRSVQTVPLQKVVADPSENVLLRPGDVVTLVRDPQTFTAFGATGGNAQLPFSANGITLAEALAKVGGLQDFRADPSGVFVFREEPNEIARALLPDNPLVRKGGPVPMVYRVDLRNPNSLFWIRSFRIFNKDLVYVSNAKLNELQKFLVLINSVTQPVNTGLSMARQFE